MRTFPLSEIGTIEEVVRDKVTEPTALLLADLRIPVAGKIDQSPCVVDCEKIDQLGFARDLGNLCQALRAGEHVDERRLSDIGAADKRKFRHGRLGA